MLILNIILNNLSLSLAIKLRIILIKLFLSYLILKLFKII